MSQEDATLILPAPQTDQAFMNVSALEAGNLTVPMDFIVAGYGPDDYVDTPSLAFVLIHAKTGVRIVFDLGVRRDIEALPPALQAFVARQGETEKKGGCRVRTEQTVDESLVKGGVTPDQIEAVIISHLHFDHTGDHTPFTKATFVLGEDCKDILASGYPNDPNSHFLVDSAPFERTRFLSRSDFSISIGPFPHALDYFGDGSMYVIDSPGHLGGHVNVLARTSSDGAWIYLGGDSAHDFRLITGEREMAYSVTDTGVVRCAHVNREVAEETIRRIGKLLKLPRVQVLIAHDYDWYNANRGGVAFFPGIISPVS
ncbi:hypothetical protein HYDPIDRAFT_110862 [Hydnomerulius pinastri MD-312]|nr:hypothetical protein HYDPIDRAFT_110862 [Hydnomerulius pinastri MD-312]